MNERRSFEGRSLALACAVASSACVDRSPDSGALADTGGATSSAEAAVGPAKHRGRSHAEVKGSIRHAKADGPRVEELGSHGEIDPVHSLWGSGPSDVYAAAWDDPGRGLLHSKGDGKWTHEDLRQRRLLAVWGSGATDVYAAGNDGVYHGHGDGKWTLEHQGSGCAVYALWGSGREDVYASGCGEVFRSKGDGSWRREPVAGDQLLLALWGSGPGD